MKQTMIHFPIILMLGLWLWPGSAGAAPTSAMNLMQKMNKVDSKGSNILKDAEDATRDETYGTDLGSPPTTVAQAGNQQPQGDYPGVILLGVKHAPVFGYFAGILGEDAQVWKDAQDAEADCKEYYDDIAKAKKSMGEAKAKLSPLLSEKKSKEAELKKKKEQLENASREEKGQLEREIGSLKREINRLDGKINPLERTINTAKNDIKSAKSSLVPLEATADRTYKDLIKAQSDAWAKWYP